MPEKLKDILIPAEQVKKLAEEITVVYPNFDSTKFINEVLDNDWQNRELKQKMRHITVCLHANLPVNYSEAIKILEEITANFNGFIALSFSDFVECYGLDYRDISMNALSIFTSSCSSEFAVRVFLDSAPQKAMPYFYKWAESENHHIRRLASEGCRPLLPWGKVLRKFREDPSPIIPILEKLKNDPSEYVRKSVSNNINDISKDHPELVLNLVGKWKNESKETDRIIKHGCRTLLKNGNVLALKLFGFTDPETLQIQNLLTDLKQIKIGESIRFSFTLNNISNLKQTVRLEYRVHYVKSNGKTSAKIFQIRENDFEPGEHLISKNQSFADFTTRKHYPGIHKIEIVVNGQTKAETSILVEN